MSTLALHSALYKTHQGTDYLSRTFQSSELHTPKDTDRGTIDEDSYQRHRNSTPRVPKAPWGRSFSYGGLGPLNLPADHRSKWEPPVRVEKGHQHFGSGISPHPRGITLQQYYAISPLQKSRVRAHDQLVPPPTQEYLGRLQISKKFPAEHPYASHISKFALFPTYDSPDDTKKGNPAIASQATLPSNTPASAPDPVIIGKTKGTHARHEVVANPPSSAKLAQTWPEGPTYYQLPKGPGHTRQIYYPTPPSCASPNMRSRSLDLSIAPNTADTLNTLIKSNYTTTYQAAFSRCATAPNPKLGKAYTSQIDNDLSKVSSSSNFQQSRPMQGRNKSVVTKSLPGTSESAGVSEHRDLNTARSTDFTRTYSDVSVDSTRSARSVQFNGSVRFSDGNSVKEIPLNGDNKENHLAQSTPKTPFPSSRGINRNKMFRSQSVNYPSYSINTMPSQTNGAMLTGSTESSLNQKKLRPQTSGSKRESDNLLELQRGWSRTEAHRKFNETYPEPTPDLRRKPDLRVTTNERRHFIPEAQAHAYSLH